MSLISVGCVCLVLTVMYQLWNVFQQSITFRIGTRIVAGILFELWWPKDGAKRCMRTQAVAAMYHSTTRICSKLYNYSNYFSRNIDWKACLCGNDISNWNLYLLLASRRDEWWRIYSLQLNTIIVLRLFSTIYFVELIQVWVVYRRHETELNRSKFSLRKILSVLSRGFFYNSEAKLSGQGELINGKEQWMFYKWFNEMKYRTSYLFWIIMPTRWTPATLRRGWMKVDSVRIRLTKMEQTNELTNKQGMSPITDHSSPAQTTVFSIRSTCLGFVNDILAFNFVYVCVSAGRYTRGNLVVRHQNPINTSTQTHTCYFILPKQHWIWRNCFRKETLPLLQAKTDI